MKFCDWNERFEESVGNALKPQNGGKVHCTLIRSKYFDDSFN